MQVKMSTRVRSRGATRTVYVLPKVDAFFGNFCRVRECEHHARAARRHESFRPKKAIARDEDRVEHALVYERVAHPLAHDDVHVLDSIRERDILNFALNNAVGAISKR